MPNILTVDDDINICYQIESVLKNTETTCEPLLEPKYLKDYLAHDLPDVIILDIMLPEISGLEVLHMLKQHPQYQNIPVIMITAETDKELLKQCFELGAIDFLRKPIEENELISRLNSVFKIREYQTSLENEILERKRVQAQLVQAAKMTALGKIGSGIAHELNTPLAVIKLSLYELKEDYEEQIFDHFPELFERMNKHIDKSAQVTNYLRNFSCEVASTDMQPVDCNALLDNLSLLQSEKLLSEGITWEKEIQDELPQVNGSRLLLQQVLLALMDNALEAVKEQPQQIIKTRAYRDKDFICFEIEDSGSGIAENIQTQIFDPFFTTKPVGSGYGLGLTASYGIIEDHFGHLRLTKTSNQGSCFQIALPVYIEFPLYTTKNNSGVISTTGRNLK